jgi:hypothetical protein
MAYTDYVGLRNCVREILATNNISDFKDKNEINAIFEHKNYSWGNIFYDLIKSEFTLTDDEIVDFCKKNDTIGKPEIQTYSFGNVAANSIKYVYHANLALKHMKSIGKNKVNIVEIGGGYGGMALAMFHYSNKYDIEIESYNLIDLPELIGLQDLYLKSTCRDYSRVKFYSAFEYGSNIRLDNLYLIGVYSLGELDVSTQMKYIEHLFPKVSHGFLIWNAVPYTKLGKDEMRVPERPLTGPHNQFIYF